MPVLIWVPPHILIMAQLTDMQRSQLDLADNIVNRMKDELDLRDIGGGYDASVVMQSMNNHYETIMKEFDKIKKKQSSDSYVSRNNVENPSTTSSNLKKDFKFHFFDGKFHILPQGWIIPNLKFQSFVTMWLLGDKSNGVPPLKVLQSKDVKHLGKRTYKILNKMRDLARGVRKAGIISGHWYDENQWDLQKVTLLFRSILKYFRFESRINGHERRFEHLSWKSVHNLYVKNKKLLVGEVSLKKDQEKHQSTMYEVPGIHVSV